MAYLLLFQTQQRRPEGWKRIATEKILWKIISKERSIVIYGKMAPAQHLARSWHPSAEQCRTGSLA
jgi:hypothetical protein